MTLIPAVVLILADDSNEYLLYINGIEVPRNYLKYERLLNFIDEKIC